MKYIGSELSLFEKAYNWKYYYCNFIKPYLHGSVLEVGAGLGGNTLILCDGTQREWTCLEPDSSLLELVTAKLSKIDRLKCCNIMKGTISDIPSDKSYDSIVYIDVLEHIENDSLELKLSSKHLKKNGFLIILAPANNKLYSTFDKTIGHYRRYSKFSLSSIIPEKYILLKIMHLDTVGFFASLLNRYFLKQCCPTEKQLLFWDKHLIPLSKFFDKVFFYSIGKSVLGIWKRI